MSSLSVPNFSLIGVHIGALWQILQSVLNKEEKTKKLKQNFGSSYLRNGWGKFLQIWYVDSPSWQALL